MAQLGTAPDSKSGKWMLFTRGFKSRPFLITNKEAGTKGAQLLCLHSYYLLVASLSILFVKGFKKMPYWALNNTIF